MVASRSKIALFLSLWLVLVGASNYTTLDSMRRLIKIFRLVAKRCSLARLKKVAPFFGHAIKVIHILALLMD